MANIESSICGGRLLIVLNGIEILLLFLHPNIIRVLLIVLNGIEMNSASTESSAQANF